jgi:Mg/Co/Ni transporter MgtE
MLRYPPHVRLGTLVDSGLEAVTANASAAEVSRILASYNLVSVPVVDDNHRLVGVVTIDDILDFLLPDDWRSHDDDDDTLKRAASRQQISTGSIPIVKARRTGSGTT